MRRNQLRPQLFCLNCIYAVHITIYEYVRIRTTRQLTNPSTSLFITVSKKHKVQMNRWMHMKGARRAITRNNSTITVMHAHTHILSIDRAVLHPKPQNACLCAGLRKSREIVDLIMSLGHGHSICLCVHHTAERKATGLLGNEVEL